MLVFAHQPALQLVNMSANLQHHLFCSDSRIRLQTCFCIFNTAHEVEQAIHKSQAWPFDPQLLLSAYQSICGQDTEPQITPDGQTSTLQQSLWCNGDSLAGFRFGNFLLFPFSLLLFPSLFFLFSQTLMEHDIFHCCYRKP